MGIVQGSRGEASRLGGSGSGIRAQAQGWNAGVKVYGDAKPLDPGNDMFQIFLTTGSNGSGFGSKPFATLQMTEAGELVVTLDDDFAVLFGAEFQSARVGSSSRAGVEA